MENSKERQEIKELTEAFAGLVKQLEVKADSDKNDPATNSQIQSCMNAIYSVANNLHSRMDRMQASIWNYQDSHASGHLPKCPSPEHMEAALKSLGWNKNFEVQKKTVYASKDMFTIKSSKK